MTQIRMSPEENYPSVNAPIWAIPMSDMTQSLPNNNQDLPSYNKFIASTDPHLDDLPPNYLDISIVPNGAVLYYDQIIPYTEASKAKIKRKNSSVYSLDPLIDKNPDQLWLYFMTYLNEKPCPFITILGNHVEYVTSTTRYPINHHRYRSQTSTSTRLVTDFNYSINLTPYVSEHYWRVAVIPSKKALDRNENISFRDALEEYTLSEKNFKEIQCQKQLIGWNFKELRDKIRGLISSTGYGGNIYIKFPVNNHGIIARSSSKLSRFSNSIWTRILCFLSCFCLIFAPIYLCLRAVSSTRHQIVADYHMISSTDTFLQMNTGTIVNAVLTRSKGRHLAKIE